MAAARTLSALPPLRFGLLRILLVRHGESLGNQRGVLDNRAESEIDALTETGKSQAASLGLALRESGVFSFERIGIAAVGSSSMQRAVETADLVASEAFPGCTRLHPVEALIETSNGNLEGRLISEVMDELKATTEAWSNGETDVRVGETGDSPKTLQDRSFVGLQSLLGQLPSESSVVLIAAHFWVNRVLLAKWQGEELSKLGEILQPNAGMSVVDIDRANPWDGIVHLVGWQASVASQAG